MNNEDVFAVEEACRLLDGIDTVKGEIEGKVTRTFLRKVLEILDEAGNAEEYLISVAYIVARKKGEDNKKFLDRLRKLLDKTSKDWDNAKKDLKKVLEYTIKIYQIRAELGENLCTKL